MLVGWQQRKVIVYVKWSLFESSLQATIRDHRPDLLQDWATTDYDNIPTEPPDGFLSSLVGVIPDVGELMLASFAKNQFDPSSWYVTNEKVKYLHLN